MQQDRKKDDLLALKIGTGILVGGLLVSIGLFFAGPERVLSLFEAIGEADRKAQQETQDKIEFYRQQAKRNEAQDEQIRLAQEEKEHREMELKKQQQQALLSKMQNLEGENKDKHAKWQQFFKQSPTCITPKTWKKQVECANERMKAEQQFEVLYRDGKL